LPVPRVVGSGDRRDPVTIQQALVRLAGKGRRTLVVDLEQSEHLERAVTESDSPEPSVRRFVVMPPESPARLVGTMVVQPPRLILESQAEVRLAGDELKTLIDWSVESQVDLEGRLRVAVPLRPRSAEDGESDDAAGDKATSEPVAPPADGDADDWFVRVNGRPAELRPVAAEVVLASDATSDAPTPDESTPDESTPGEAAPGEPASRASDGGDEDAAEPAARYYDIISEELANGTIEIHFEHSRTLASPAGAEANVAVGMPSPVVEDVTLKGDLTVALLGDETRTLASAQESLSDELMYRSLPSEPIALRIAPRPPAKSELLTGKVVTRTAISEVAQHDQILAGLRGAGDFQLWLRSPDQTDLQVQLDGAPVAYKISDRRLLVKIPEGGDGHVLDVRLWLDRSERGLLRRIEPLAHVGPSSEKSHWQLLVPADNHLIWAMPSLGRVMQWTLDRWRLIRRPLMSETALINRVATGDPERVELSPMPTGNRYLFSATDDRTFHAMTSSRTLLWLAVAGVIVLIAAVLTYLPATRNPFTLVVGIVAYCGLVAVSPDAAVLVGQVAMLALVLVIVMLAIRSLVLPAPSRVLTSTQESRFDGSTQSGRPLPEYRPPSSVAATHSIGPEDVTSTPGEVAS
jgi:hypothetical protein